MKKRLLCILMYTWESFQKVLTYMFLCSMYVFLLSLSLSLSLCVCVYVCRSFVTVSRA